MGYTTPAAIRAKTGYTTTDITDAGLNEIIAEATTVINSEINVHVTREIVSYIDYSRQNKIDGSNTTFYSKNSINFYFADSNDDGSLTTADIKVELEDNDGNITEATVSSIDSEGSFVLASAPPTNTVRMYLTYDYSYYDISIPDKMVTLLATYLASSYSILIVDAGLPYSTKLGNLAITVPIANTLYRQVNDRYDSLLKQAKIPCNKPISRTYKYMI